jgi:predicted PurR-regulated permease PerM
MDDMIPPGPAEAEPALPTASRSDDEQYQQSAREAQRELARAKPGAATVSLVILTILAVFYTLSFAAAILLPLLFALVLNLLLAPLKRPLTERLHFPAPLAAAVLLLAVFAVIFGLATAISVPASNWLAKAPQGLPQLQERFHFLAEPIAFVQQGADKMAHLLQQEPALGQPTVAVQQSTNLSGVGITILEGTRAALAQFLTLAVVLFFLLADGDTLLRRLVEIAPTWGDKRRVVEIASEIENNISSYLATITAMNLLVGIGNGISMWLLGMPDPLLWGTAAFMLNYIPILGPFTGMVIFFFVGVFSTPSLWQAALPPAVYLAIHIIEAQSVTPLLLARRFTLNPVLVIISLFFWNWLWGVPGAFLAVPLLAILKIVADRIPVLTPFGHLLGGAPRAD